MIREGEDIVLDLRAVALDAIRKHGDDAWFSVSQLADQALERGDMELRSALLDLLKEVEILIATPPAASIH